MIKMIVIMTLIRHAMRQGTDLNISLTIFMLLSSQDLFCSSVQFPESQRERGREGERECLSLAWQSLHIPLLLYCDCVIYSAISTSIVRMRNSLSIALRSDKRSA